MALFALSYIKRFWGDGCTCQPLAVWAYNRFWPILPKIWAWFYSQTTPKLVGAWHPKSPSGTYVLTKFFRLINKLMMRPMTTISSLASLTTSAITVPKPLRMAQSNRKYSMNISIVFHFFPSKLVQTERNTKFIWVFLRWSLTSMKSELIIFYETTKVSAAFLPISTQSFCLTEQPSAASPIPHQRSFPSMQKLRDSDNQYYINTETLNLRFYNNQIIRNSVFHQFSI